MKSFTLIELILVIVIIGVLAAVSLPAFNSAYNNIKIEGVYRQLMQDIKYARQLAITRQTAHGISFAESGDSYWLYRLNVSGMPMFASVKDPATQKPLSVTYVSGIFSGARFTTGFQPVPYPGRLEFNSVGAPAIAGAVSISYNGVTKTITVEENTGRVY